MSVVTRLVAAGATAAAVVAGVVFAHQSAGAGVDDGTGSVGSSTGDDGVGSSDDYGSRRGGPVVTLPGGDAPSHGSTGGS